MPKWFSEQYIPPQIVFKTSSNAYAVLRNVRYGKKIISPVCRCHMVRAYNGRKYEMFSEIPHVITTALGIIKEFPVMHKYLSNDFEYQFAHY